MPPPTNRPSCGVCANKLVKNGTTTAGRTRWRCRTCGASTTQTRTDISRKAELTAFLDWLNNPLPQGAGTIPARTFRQRTAWCWNITPKAPQTSQIHRQLQLDGTYFNGWCVLIAYTGTHVVDWQWCDREKTASWTALIERIPAPDYAIIDGNGPLRTVVSEHWPTTTIQRCHFHIRQTITKHLTRKPVLPANRELVALVGRISQVTTVDEAAAWTGEFASWEARWRVFLNARTTAKNAVFRPDHVRPGQKWWYTHLRSRRAWRLIAALVREDQIFAWIHSIGEGRVDRATSRLEGGPNKAIKDLLRAHRGLTPVHARRAVDWLLYQRTGEERDAWSFVEGEPWARVRGPVGPVSERVGPAVYDTGFSWEDGIGIQKGWGGRRG